MYRTRWQSCERIDRPFDRCPSVGRLFESIVCVVCFTPEIRLLFSSCFSSSIPSTCSASISCSIPSISPSSRSTLLARFFRRPPRHVRSGLAPYRCSRRYLPTSSREEYRIREYQHFSPQFGASIEPTERPLNRSLGRAGDIFLDPRELSHSSDRWPYLIALNTLSVFSSSVSILFFRRLLTWNSR